MPHAGEIVYLNADEHGFQTTPIDKGVLALGQHCHRLQYLDLYDRLMAEPIQTIATAVEGWPLLRYLCFANTTPSDSEESWFDLEGFRELPARIASLCPNIHQLVFYGETEEEDFVRAEMERVCPLYGKPVMDADEDAAFAS
ncbi:unnamed protein product [Effrenium voratum]|nr:unnamed protein product [Effrenium voratum]